MIEYLTGWAGDCYKYGKGREKSPAKKPDSPICPQTHAHRQAMFLMQHLLYLFPAVTCFGDRRSTIE